MTQCDERYKLQLVTQVPDLNSAYLWGNSEQASVAASGNVLFESSDIKDNVVSYDSSGVITFNEDGRFLVEYYVASSDATDTTPPIDVYFAANINGTIENNSLYGGVQIAAEGDIQLICGQFIYTATATDTMEIINQSIDSSVAGVAIKIPAMSNPNCTNTSVVITKLNN